MKEYILKKLNCDRFIASSKYLILHYDFILGFWYIKDGRKQKFKNVDKKYKYIIFVFNNLKEDVELKVIDKIVCRVKKIDRSIIQENIKTYVIFNKCNSKYDPFVQSSVNLINKKGKKERLNFLYDSICNYLDNIVVKNNVCEFKNDKCLAKRNTNCTMGCCHHFKNKYFGILYETKLHLCEYQKNKSCTTKCITCKMFMCDTVKKKGYDFTTRNVILIKRYFNLPQKLIILTSFFTPKEKIMKRLLFYKLV